MLKFVIYRREFVLTVFAMSGIYCTSTLKFWLWNWNLHLSHCLPKQRLALGSLSAKTEIWTWFTVFQNRDLPWVNVFEKRTCTSVIVWKIRDFHLIHCLPKQRLALESLSVKTETCSWVIVCQNRDMHMSHCLSKQRLAHETLSAELRLPFRHFI